MFIYDTLERLFIVKRLLTKHKLHHLRNINRQDERAHVIPESNSLKSNFSNIEQPTASDKDLAMLIR